MSLLDRLLGRPAPSRWPEPVQCEFTLGDGDVLVYQLADAGDVTIRTTLTPAHLVLTRNYDDLVYIAIELQGGNVVRSPTAPVYHKSLHLNDLPLSLPARFMAP